MKELMRSAPLLLFLLLLLILGLSVYFGNATTKWAAASEGFIGFNPSGQLISKLLTIPQYSSAPVVQVYDNIYFDTMNTNLLELRPGKGSDISAISVYDRNGNKHGPYDNGSTVTESSNPEPNDAYSAFMMSSKLSDTSANIVYASWGKETFLHAFDLSQNVNVLSASFPGSQMSSMVRAFAWSNGAIQSATSAPNSIAALKDSGSTTMTDPSDGMVVAVPYYDPSLVQICKKSYYDKANGNLVLLGTDGSLNVYERPYLSYGAGYSDPLPKIYNQTKPYTSENNPQIINTATYYPFMLVHPNGDYMIYYIVNGLNTILLPIVKSGGGLKLLNKGYFYNPDGTIATATGNYMKRDYSDNDGQKNHKKNQGQNQNQNQNKNQNQNQNKNQNQNQNKNPPNPLSDYYNWLAFWNTVVNSNDVATAMQSSNYIPKTAVVPPVCPTCSQCSGGSCGGVCTNCGGQGGSGTNTGRRNRFSDFLGMYGQGLAAGTGGGLGGAGGGDADAQRAFELAKAAGSGTVGLVRDAGKAGLGVLAVGAGLGVDAVEGTVGLAKDAVGGTVGLAKDAVGGAVGLAKDTVGGAVGLAKDAGSGITGVLKSHPTQLGGGGGSGESDANGQGPDSNGGYYGRGSKGTRGDKNMIDPYSYNGALVSKGGNYIPVTADFSAFGK